MNTIAMTIETRAVLEALSRTFYDLAAEQRLLMNEETQDGNRAMGCGAALAASHGLIERIIRAGETPTNLQRGCIKT